MESEIAPELVIQLQAQTSTAHLSTDEFDAKTGSAAGRISALLKAQTDALNNAGQIGFVAAKALVGELPPGYISAGPQNANRPLVAHPDELVPLLLEPVLKDNDSDTGSDVTERPSYDTESPAQSWSPNSLRQFTIKQEDGSYKDADIRTMDMQDVAPWLYQDTQSLPSTYETPPSSLSRASRANNLVRKRLSQTLEGIENNEAMISTPSLTPLKTVTSIDRKGSLTSLFTPSPTLSVRKISKKFSLANLRKDSLKSDKTNDSSPLGRSFPSKTEGHDGNSSGSTSTIGCDPYEKQPCGPNPIVPNAELEVDDESPRTGGAEPPEGYTRNSAQEIDLRSRRIPEFRPLSVITTALNWDIIPVPYMDQIAQAHHGNKTKKKVPRYMSGQRQVSTDTVILGSNQRTPNSEECRDVTTSSSTLPTIHGDVATLFNAPPPLLIDHPFFRDDENAFKVKTDYPLMTTSTPVYAIKTFANDMAQLSSKSAGSADDLRKKRSYRNLGGLLPMSAPPMRMAFDSELSSAVAAKNASKARASNGSVPTTPPLTRVATYETDSLRGKSMRKISTIFTRGSRNCSPAVSTPATESSKKKITKIGQKHVEDTVGESTLEMWIRKREERMPGMPWKLTKEECFYVEQFVRNHLAYHRKDYKPGKWPHYPHHPNNPKRAWDHENLRCVSCIDDYCASCGKVCCAYKAINLRLGLFSKESEENNGMKEMLAGLFPDLDPKEKKSPREATKELKDILDSTRPTRDGKIMGGETSTFIQCTECKKMVCPTCCGICPIDGCGDTLCRKCKGGDPWESCKWHDRAQE